MKRIPLLPTLLAVLLLHLSTLSHAATSKSKADKILLSKVHSLTLRADKQTSHRRVPAVPQLSCVGAACKHYQVDVLRCTNAGAEYSAEDVQWTCTAALPPEFKLGATDVACEGYDGPDDPHVLKGSCGVEYRLMLTAAGEEKFGPGSGGNRLAGGGGGSGRYDDDEDAWWHEAGRGKSEAGKTATLLFWVLFVGVLGWIAYSAWSQAQGNRRTPGTPRRRGPRSAGFGGGGGGGGGGDNDDPPPPYDSPPSYSKPSSSTFGSRAQGSGQWRPGFWTGMGAGAAGTWAANRMAGGGRQDRQAGSGWGSNPYGEGSSRSAPRSSGSSGGSGSSYSSTRYESTGFGGTSRR